MADKITNDLKKAVSFKQLGAWGAHTPTTLPLADDPANYDIIIVYCTKEGTTYYFSTVVLPRYNLSYVASTEGVYVTFNFSGSNVVETGISSGCYISGVYGYKLGSALS